MSRKYEDYNNGPYLDVLESAGYVLSSYHMPDSADSFYTLLCPDGLRLLGLNEPDGYADVLAQGWAHYKNQRRLESIEQQAGWLEHKCGEVALTAQSAKDGNISPIELLDRMYQFALEISTYARPALGTAAWHIERDGK